MLSPYGSKILFKSLGFRDINIFSFPQKFKMAAKVAKIEIFQLHIEYSTTTMRVKISVEMASMEIFQFCIEYFPTTLRAKNSVQIALSITVSEILRFFRFSQKFKMATKSGEN